MFATNSQLATSPSEWTLKDAVEKVESSSLCRATLSPQAISIITAALCTKETSKRKIDSTAADMNSNKTNFMKFNCIENEQVPHDLVVPIVIQKTIDEKLQALIPVESPTDSLLEIICHGKEEVISLPHDHIYVDVTHDYRNVATISEESTSSSSSSTPPSYDSDDQESCISALTMDSTPRATSSPPSTAHKMLLTINPATVTYVIIENVLCAVVPLVTPASYRAALVAGHIHKPRILNTVTDSITTLSSTQQGSDSEGSSDGSDRSEGEKESDEMSCERDEVL
jgi:hypothetical protein